MKLLYTKDPENLWAVIDGIKKSGFSIQIPFLLRNEKALDSGKIPGSEMAHGLTVRSYQICMEDKKFFAIF